MPKKETKVVIPLASPKNEFLELTKEAVKMYDNAEAVLNMRDNAESSLEELNCNSEKRASLRQTFRNDMEKFAAYQQQRAKFNRAYEKLTKPMRVLSWLLFLGFSILGLILMFTLPLISIGGEGGPRLVPEDGAYILLIVGIAVGIVAALITRKGQSKKFGDLPWKFENQMFEIYSREYYLSFGKAVLDEVKKISAAVAELETIDAETIESYRRFIGFLPNHLRTIGAISYILEAFDTNRVDTLREAYDFAERKIGEDQRNAAEAEHRQQALASQLAQEEEARRQAEYARQQAEELKKQTYYAKEAAAAAREQAARAADTAEAARKAAETAEEIRRGY